MVINLGKTDSIFNQYIAELRDVEIQRDPLRFRHNLVRIGEIAAYEISKKLAYENKDVHTSLGTASVPVLKELPVVIPILRAGLPVHEGALRVFDRSQSGFISAYRKVEKNESFSIQVEYISCPDINKRTLIICDPMLATGASIVAAYKALLHYGTPSYIHIISAIASTEGINYLKRQLPMSKISIWTGAVDDELTAQAYIVPGLGDAGDLAYGDKT
ncbi:MAG: uracil phosphoribosyltransferase [Bacteroidales bacterium]|nr:uracil phosphoribosyltransferase [Bacteroidales bacterium]MCF8403048.1 uracil phosphoribosyltransferase [Bacteroidales bacterium]